MGRLAGIDVEIGALFLLCAPQAQEVLQGSSVECKAIRKMVAGPPKSAIRGRLQTTSSGGH